MATIVQIIATMPIGFYAVYALQRFSANETMVGAFTLAMVAVQVVSSFGMGYLVDRWGNKLALIIAAGALFLANVWAMFAPSLEWFIVVFIFFGINLGTEILARYNIAIEYGPPEQRALYIGVMNTLIAPFYLVSLVGGALVEGFGYMAVFGIGTNEFAEHVPVADAKPCGLTRVLKILGVTSDEQKEENRQSRPMMVHL